MEEQYRQNSLNVGLQIIAGYKAGLWHSTYHMPLSIYKEIMVNGIDIGASIAPLYLEYKKANRCSQEASI